MKVCAIRTHVTWGEPRNWVFVKVETDTELHGRASASSWTKRRWQPAHPVR